METFTKTLKTLWGQLIPVASPIACNRTANTIAFLESALALAECMKVQKFSEESGGVA